LVHQISGPSTIDKDGTWDIEDITWIIDMDSLNNKLVN